MHFRYSWVLTLKHSTALVTSLAVATFYCSGFSEMSPARAQSINGGAGGSAGQPGTAGETGFDVGGAGGAGGAGGVLPGANGGTGASGINGGAGGGGGGGQFGNGPGTITLSNSVILKGGRGGDGGGGSDAAQGGGGSAGSGGAADEGGQGGLGTYPGSGGGGAGGAGALVTGSGIVSSNSGDIVGGDGGNGGTGEFGTLPASGGGGGSGIIFTGTGISFSNALGGSVSGGKGGTTTNDSFPTGNGGAGGHGIRGNDLSVENSGSITGGGGGTGGALNSNSGGIGGDGIHGDRLVITNNAGSTITGGDGGVGRFNGPPGRGGNGIRGSDLSIINAGAINGGVSTNSFLNGEAITFSGGNNKLELRDGFSFRGVVNAYSSISAVLALGGADNGTFSAGSIGQTFKGFSQFEKTGSGTWVVEGSSYWVTPWSILEGTLQIDNDMALGDASGLLTIANGATLKTTDSFGMSRNIQLDSGGGNIDVTDGSGVVLYGEVSGVGGLNKSGNGTLTLAAANSYSGGTTIEDGVLQVGDGGATGTIGGDLVNNAILAFNRSDTYAFDGTISGSGSLQQIGGGTTLLDGQGSYTGETVVAAGTLAAGGTNIFSAVSDFSVAEGASLALNSFDQNLKSLDNAGTVSLGGKGGTTMTVSGDFTGSGGTLVLNSVLGGDASVTDRLVVNGNTSGTGLLKVVNAGGAGAPTIEGIRIVQVNGSSDATFTLTGDYVHEGQQAVVGGAYAYKLYKNGVASPSDGDWYLRSQLKNPVIPTDPVDPGGPTEPGDPAPQGPLYQAGASGYEAYPQVLLGLNRVSTLQQRVGTRVWSGKGNRIIAQGADTAGAAYASPDETGSAIGGNGVWGRIEGAYQKINPRLSASDSAFDQNIFRMQAGLDAVLTQTASGTLIGGVTAHYTHGRTGTHSVHGDVEISTDGYGFGGNLTWYGENGLYLDGQGQVTWYRSDLHSLLANTGLTRDNDGFGYALSVESGQRIAIDPVWSVTPQAQLAYSSVDFDNFVDVFRAPIRLERGDSLQGRLGMTLDYQSSWQNSQGMQDRTHIYGVANLYYEFLEGTKVAVADTSLASRDERLWGGLGMGGSYSWNDDKYTIYGEGLLDTSLASFADSYSIKSQIGFRVKW